jgi:hypothetical protein
MKAKLLAVGVVAFSVSCVAVGSPAPSPAFVHKKKASPYEARPAVPCLIGTAKCAAQNDPPMRTCDLGARGTESCSTEGAKVIDAYH